MIDGYYTVGMEAPVLRGMVKRYGVTKDLKHLSRLLFLSNCSLASSLVSLPDRLFYHHRVNEHAAPTQPVFIVGHWRSGTTFLYQCFSLNDQTYSPDMYDVGLPNAFMAARNFMFPVIKPFLKSKRTIDNVEVDIHEPQEDEFALYRMCSVSPLREVVFNNSPWRNLCRRETYLPEGAEGRLWKRHAWFYLSKLALHSGKQLIIKNPFHSMRIPRLKKLFPGARFIHIYRDPLKVVPSTQKMWRIDGGNNTLRGSFRPPSVDEGIRLYDFVHRSIRSGLEEIDSADYVEQSFEDFVKNPEESIWKMCRHLDLPVSDVFQNRLSAFLDRKKNYRKNRYETPKDTVRAITE
ncbi:MAG: sulfotransferase family protein, partial [Fibrobacterota bacterium]